jgi:hypothetical protein
MTVKVQLTAREEFQPSPGCFWTGRSHSQHRGLQIARCAPYKREKTAITPPPAPRSSSERTRSKVLGGSFLLMLTLWKSGWGEKGTPSFEEKWGLLRNTCRSFVLCRGNGARLVRSKLCRMGQTQHRKTEEKAEQK